MSTIQFHINRQMAEIKKVIKNHTEIFGCKHNIIGDIQAALEKCWDGADIIVWGTDDIMERARETDNEMIEEEAKAVLDSIMHRHDCDIGINWSVIDDEISFKISNRKTLNANGGL